VVRPLIFYSAWPLGYHNPEAERKAEAFAAAGYATVYVAGVGIRNPRLSTVPKALDRLARKLRDGGGAEADGGTIANGVHAGSVLVVPPRQVAPVRRLNARWMERQLRALGAGPDAVLWVRWPTPELVDALPRLRPAATIYECVDAYHATPGMTGRWLPRHEDAERRLVAFSDAVVVPSDHLADRFREAPCVRLVPHGVDLDRFRFEPPRARPLAEPVVGFVGTLDYKLDLGFLTHLARECPHWRIRLIGPIQEGFDPASLSWYRNVTIEPPVPYERVGPTIASFDASMMPYFDAPLYAASDPLKNLEIMAVGRPAVARPTRALEPYADLLYFAHTPAEFVAQLDRALAEDSEPAARRRRERAHAHSWERRMRDLTGVLDALNVGTRAADIP
jgi:glycosyltransferase involved in cell wall biosynthesis